VEYLKEGRRGGAPADRPVEDRGAEGILLGCTEIDLLIGPLDAPVPVLTPTRLHAERAVDLAWRPDYPLQGNSGASSADAGLLLGERLEPGKVPAVRRDHLVPDAGVKDAADGSSGHPVGHPKA
jgi:hypothetical protein